MFIRHKSWDLPFLTTHFFFRKLLKIVDREAVTGIIIIESDR